ncbi:MAG: 50S ribosomal protein L29 [Candidatus Colwellbacteria bacterium RIFCSPLOWO2_12_FULL_44_13]|uniref:Large ribosomal subunit protein uL29 n=3 Tax=Candidatus Colwelliibacteriota TaxID=1817904 RepID=A0A1G1Z8B8_9BACT|nr:MAG: 50S ribosomal protein L29 [Candidatus Colwellbacteria bacterium RIFCSPHIGHO2_12_FULL_44_17]OGY60296.1 MAG: 50S ribosomal protein L29 [Candidatus Colwellbacteria bacterium RIFCSPLOWO2_02_FULL_44_20b]OGY61519.1 MAG: 50S ribosomal protein L29 [Candidatus Colwellbacteria bacterium RIFCSPLOWO2_12_FULL_44_13]
MKKREFQNMKNSSAGELIKNTEESRERLRVLKFDLAAGKVKNVKEIRQIKQAIAQILTVIKTKQEK